jgi:hypothetical protein
MYSSDMFRLKYLSPLQVNIKSLKSNMLYGYKIADAELGTDWKLSRPTDKVKLNTV